MGYESRIYIVDRYKTIFDETERYASTIAIYDGSGMPNGFREIFKNEIDFCAYEADGNTLLEKDKYGKICKYTDVQTVIEWLENQIQKDDYRRLKPLLGLLKGFDLSKWEDLKVVHYGY